MPTNVTPAGPSVQFCHHKPLGCFSDAFAGLDAALECAIVRMTSGSSILRAMELADYLRDQAVMYRKLAEQADDPVVKNEMLDLASVCEEVANNIEDHLTGG